MAVEDGRPFCPHCRAPQISVKVADAETEVVAATLLDEFSPEIPAETRDVSGKSMDRALAARSAIKAGVLGFFLGMFLPFLAIVLAGALAVYFYRRESGVALSTALGSRLGSAAGVVAIGIQSIFFTIWIFVFHRQQEYIDSVTRVLHSVGADASIPEIQTSLRTMFTPMGLAFTLFFVMMIALVLASIGGALASLWMRPRHPRA